MAPKDATLPGILNDTVASLETAIGENIKRIDANRAEIAAAKGEISAALKASGVELQPEQVDMLQVIKRQWAKIGIDMDVNALERTFFYQRTSDSNDHDAAVWGGEGSWVPGDIPQQIVPVHHDSRWGIPWVNWYKSGGKQGEEPPASVKERMKLYDAA